MDTWRDRPRRRRQRARQQEPGSAGGPDGTAGIEHGAFAASERASCGVVVRLVARRGPEKERSRKLQNEKGNDEQHSKIGFAVDMKKSDPSVSFEKFAKPSVVPSAKRVRTGDKVQPASGEQRILYRTKLLRAQAAEFDGAISSSTMPRETSSSPGPPR